ncbi:hypothetical protein LZ32DRAFT_86337 [Colletotrichum eremochloae]|nr:hypothetical protein LZ32DRAFT_86337 [Colletotrichum eremochloae]
MADRPFPASPVRGKGSGGFGEEGIKVAVTVFAVVVAGAKKPARPPCVYDGGVALVPWRQVKLPRPLLGTSSISGPSCVVGPLTAGGRGGAFTSHDGGSLYSGQTNGAPSSGDRRPWIPGKHLNGKQRCDGHGLVGWRRGSAGRLVRLPKLHCDSRCCKQSSCHDPISRVIWAPGGGSVLIHSGIVKVWVANLVLRPLLGSQGKGE